MNNNKIGDKRSVSFFNHIKRYVLKIINIINKI